MIFCSRLWIWLRIRGQYRLYPVFRWSVLQYCWFLEWSTVFWDIGFCVSGWCSVVLSLELELDLVQRIPVVWQRNICMRLLWLGRVYYWPWSHLWAIRLEFLFWEQALELDLVFMFFIQLLRWYSFSVSFWEWALVCWLWSRREKFWSLGQAFWEVRWQAFLLQN